MIWAAQSVKKNWLKNQYIEKILFEVEIVELVILCTRVNYVADLIDGCGLLAVRFKKNCRVTSESVTLLLIGSSSVEESLLLAEHQVC